MYSKALVLVAGLAVVSAAQATMLIDFGNSGGYDGNQVYTVGTGANGWGNFWGSPSAQSYTADTGIFNWTMTGIWQNGAAQVGGWGGAYTDRVSPYTGVNAVDFLAIRGRLVSAPEGMTFFKLQVAFKAVDGSESQWQIYPDVSPWSNTKFTDTMQVVNALTDVGHPSWVDATNGAFDFATDKLSEFQVMFQSADPGPAGNVIFEFDNIQTVAVPEPTSLAAIAAAGVLLARRRK